MCIRDSGSCKYTVASMLLRTCSRPLDQPTTGWHITCLLLHQKCPSVRPSVCLSVCWSVYSRTSSLLFLAIVYRGKKQHGNCRINRLMWVKDWEGEQRKEEELLWERERVFIVDGRKKREKTKSFLCVLQRHWPQAQDVSKPTSAVCLHPQITIAASDFWGAPYTHILERLDLKNRFGE